MRAKSERRLQAEALRREQGLPYREIEALTGVNRSTLSAWLKAIQLSAEQEQRLQARLRANRGSFAARALPINRERHARIRDGAYAAGVEVANSVPIIPAVHELAVAMLYLGEGSKTGNSVVLSNTNPAILRFFVASLRQLYGVDEQRLVFRMHLIELARPQEARLLAWWCAELGCGPERFRQTGYDRRRQVGVLTPDYHGVCVVSYHDTILQQRLMGLAQAYMARWQPSTP